MEKGSTRLIFTLVSGFEAQYRFVGNAYLSIVVYSVFGFSR